MLKMFYKKLLASSYLFFFLVFFSYPFLEAQGQIVPIKNGVNIQASYYNRGVVNIGWDLMKTYPDIEAVRIEIEPYRVAQARQWIKQAHEHGYQVIATYHDSKQLGSNKIEDLQAAATWWRNHYKELSSSGPIIINVMNEWGNHTLSPMDYAMAYNDAITIIREVYKGPLIVDIPGFGQATEIAADAYPLFLDKTIIFSVHIYTGAVNIKQNRWLNEEDLAYLAAAGATCMVGEFCDAGRGGTDWCSLIDYCYQNGWAILGWAWNGDGSNMNMVEPHWRNQPLATSFTPTPFLEKIMDKLAGIPCFTKPNDDCTAQLIDTPCDDQNGYTVNDRYNEHCHCTGFFTNTLQTATTDPSIFIYPNPVGSNNQLFIELLKIHRKGQLSIFNSLGQRINLVEIDTIQKRSRINLSYVPSGVYWVVFHAGGERLAAASFVKM